MTIPLTPPPRGDRELHLHMTTPASGFTPSRASPAEESTPLLRDQSPTQTVSSTPSRWRQLFWGATATTSTVALVYSFIHGSSRLLLGGGTGFVCSVIGFWFSTGEQKPQTISDARIKVLQQRLKDTEAELQKTKRIQEDIGKHSGERHTLLHEVAELKKAYEALNQRLDGAAAANPVHQVEELKQICEELQRKLEGSIAANTVYRDRDIKCASTLSSALDSLRIFNATASPSVKSSEGQKSLEETLRVFIDAAFKRIAALNKKISEKDTCIKELCGGVDNLTRRQAELEKNNKKLSERYQKTLGALTNRSQPAANSTRPNPARPAPPRTPAAAASTVAAAPAQGAAATVVVVATPPARGTAPTPVTPARKVAPSADDQV